ncbi:MAG: imidazole glycerol phosphate synthase subunit HisH [Actinobacteria bacterium]|nr:MAG: imidazole glycerol phosphate synthase subunit HisH [Actinomycetota bacterium]
MLAVINYGMGNLRSVLNALAALGADARVVDTAAELGDAEKIILPGVGAFGDGMANLRRAHLAAAIIGHAKTGKPLLGICLGMQLLASESTEHGQHAGLDLIPGSVERIAPGHGLRVPHVGWNSIKVIQPSPLLDDLEAEPTFYFLHSYHLIPAQGQASVATVDYGERLVACVQRANVFGAQFHPEKSQRDGLRVLKNFLSI